MIGRLLGGVDDDDRQGGLGPTRRHQEILALWDDPIVQQVMDVAETILWSPVQVTGSKWFRRRYISTLAEAINVAILSLLPDVPEDDLAVDVLETPETISIVVSETTSGGLIKVGKKMTLLRVLTGGKVEVVDGLVKVNIVPASKAPKWIEEMKARKST